MFSPRQQEIIAATVGYQRSDEEVLSDILRWAGTPTKELKKLLGAKSAAFQQAGGRGVDLADDIDSIRVAIALR